MSCSYGKSSIGRAAFEDDGQAAIAEFIRTRGVTRCPTACLLPTQGLVDGADRAALKAYAAARERLRQEEAAVEEAAKF
jgi:hypothetical protein